MTRDPLTTLRALNPAHTSQAPSIERLWTRLDFEAGAPDLPVRRPVWGSRLAVALTVAVALAIAVGGVLGLRSPHRGAPAAAPDVSSLTRILGVLRRPQTAADRAVLRQVHGSLLFNFVAHPTGPRFEPVRSLARAAARLPGGGRVGLVPVVQPLAGGPARVGLAIFDDGGAGCCSTAAQIENGTAYSSSGGVGGPDVLDLVIPDGVARVRYALPRPVTVQVHDNVAVIRADVENPRQYGMTWLAPDGSVVKRFRATQSTAANPVRTQPGDWRGGRNSCRRASAACRQASAA